MQKLQVDRAGQGTGVKVTTAKLASIEMDTSIQCRAVIDTATVSEYAERMTEGDKFPPVVLFQNGGKFWIGDGWHRIMAARQMGALDIPADVRIGGRKDALQYALGANAANGLRRSNADKRRCVEIALAEFGDISSRQIAIMCGVGHEMVDAARPHVAESATSTRTDTLGRKQPATKPRTPPTLQSADRHETPAERSTVGRPEADKQAAIEAEEARYTDQQAGRAPDPLDNPKAQTSNKAAEVYTSETMAGLKRYWKQANKKERVAFIKWTESYEN